QSAAATGPVYMYYRQSGTWGTAPTITLNTSTAPLNNGQQMSQFGSSLAVDGNRLAIGHRAYNSSRGAAYVFTFGNGNLTYEGTVTETASAAGSTNYGASVAVRGNDVFVGGTGSTGTGAGVGRVFMTTR